MNLFHDSLAATLDARQRAITGRPLDAPDNGRLTTAEENGIQGALEQLARDEVDECVERVRDFLNSAPGRRARQDYIDFRVNTATEDERAQLLAGL